MTKLIDCVYRNDLEGAKVALSHPANIDDRDGAGRTALIQASIDGKIAFIELFLRCGADVNVQDQLGYSALHYAAQGSFLDVAALLIEHGADIDAEDVHGNTPLARATFESRGRGEMIALLVKAGADRDHQNKHGISPVGLANTISNYDVKQFFEQP